MQTDVLLDPFRPHVLNHLKLGPDRLCAINSGLIYARVTGYGQTGPLAERAGHDINYVAMSGVLSVCPDSRASCCEMSMEILPEVVGFIHCPCAYLMLRVYHSAFHRSVL